MRDRILELTDIVRETGYAIHCYHGPGHLEKVYENALVHRLRKRGIAVEQQKPLTVYDEDGTVIGEYVADILVEGQLILEVKVAKVIIDDHIAQTLGYLRSARLEHGVLVNFGAPKFQIRKFVMSEALHQPERGGLPPLLILLFASFCVSCGYLSSSVWAGSAAPALGLPVFRHQAVVLDYKDLRYNPSDDIIYLAWSKDGRRWETRRTPVLDPPPGTDQVAGAWHLHWQGRHYLIAHANRAADPGAFNVNFNLYVAEVDAAFERTKHLGLFYDRTSVSPSNEAVMSPCILAEGSKLYMFVNIGPRLHNKIALAVADIPTARLEIRDDKLVCDRDKSLGLQGHEEASRSPYQN